MDYEDLLILIDRLDQSTLSYLDYQTDSHHVLLAKEMPESKNKAESVLSLPQKESEERLDQLKEKETKQTDQREQKATEVPEDEAELVLSPMIGVAYLQANPDEDAYVELGDRVEQGETVCIIEAMKIMNEIQAPVSGIVTEILIENEAVVEFNQALIRIKVE